MAEPTTSGERTFFSAGTRIEGTLELEGEVKLEGQIKGKITGTGVVTVGDKANVQADIKAPAVVIHGVVRGEVHATERLELHRTAKIAGVLRAPRIRIDEGAIFEGECRMGPSQGAEATDKRPPVTLAPSPAPVATPQTAAAPSALGSAAKH